MVSPIGPDPSAQVTVLVPCCAAAPGAKVLQPRLAAQVRAVRHFLRFLALLGLLALTACARGQTQVNGWQATQAGMEMSIEEGAGPQGEPVLALLYTIRTGQDYAIQRSMPVPGLEGEPRLLLWGKATRVLHLAVVLVDRDGREYECADTLLPDRWQELQFETFHPFIGDWAQVSIVRLVDRTGGLGGQGPVSLRLFGLPL
jgi:hypothetical protein